MVEPTKVDEPESRSGFRRWDRDPVVKRVEYLSSPARRGVWATGVETTLLETVSATTTSAPEPSRGTTLNILGLIVVYTTPIATSCLLDPT